MTDSGRHGSSCRYKHDKISNEEFERLNKKREEALAQKKGKQEGKGKGKGKGKGSCSRSSSFGPSSAAPAIDDAVCRAWRKGRPCLQGGLDAFLATIDADPSMRGASNELVMNCS